jgi:hypothetical protein
MKGTKMLVNFPNRGNFDTMPPHRRPDLDWSDKFIAEAKQLIIDNWEYILDSIISRVSKDVKNKVFTTPTLNNIEVGSKEDDSKRGTDLFFVVRYSVDSVIRIGCRIQKDKGYRNISIRTYRISGVRTEYDKMKEDKILTLYFFGWASENELNDWLIYDPIKFVELGLADLCKQREIWCEKPPKKLETKFGSVSLKEAKDCILCSSMDDTPDQIKLF